MVTRRRSKMSRARGTWTHGWGAKKKHRGSGHRGGKGNAGSGKRADSKKPSYWKDTQYMGKYGFVMKGRVQESEPLNVSDLEDRLLQWKAEKKVAEKNGSIHIDLPSLGYTKLLGSGSVNHKFIVTVSSATKKAIEEVQRAGGKVILNNGVENSDQQSS